LSSRTSSSRFLSMVAVVVVDTWRSAGCWNAGTRAEVRQEARAGLKKKKRGTKGVDGDVAALRAVPARCCWWIVSVEKSVGVVDFVDDGWRPSKKHGRLAGCSNRGPGQMNGRSRCEDGGQ
jgi:hypothetical protein